MDATEPAIRVTNLQKSFLLPHQRQTTLKQAFVNLGRKNYKTHRKVLDGVSFEVQKGEFFGIVGRNGGGKSTLLRLLAGVYHPSAGKVDVNGELTPFIELGVGFNPELSGRDNVFLNGALLGFSKKEMLGMYDEIVAFAELEEFMDQKLKNYSSGMQVRLAFSIAIKAHNDILIFDEVLAVGDEAFQRKCLDVFEQYKANKQTVILVTHDMETVRQFCDRALLLSEGKIVEIGNPQKIADHYSRLNQQSIDAEVSGANSIDHTVSIKTGVYSESRRPKVSFETGDDLFLKLGWKANPRIDNIVVNVYKKSGEHITGFKSSKDGMALAEGQSEAWIKLHLDLAPGKYHFLISARTKEDEEVETLYDGAEFTVLKNWKKAGRAWSGLVPLDHQWID